MRNTREYPITHAERMEVLARLRDRSRGLVGLGDIDMVALDQCIILLNAHRTGTTPPPDEHRKD